MHVEITLVKDYGCFKAKFFIRNDECGGNLEEIKKRFDVIVEALGTTVPIFWTVPRLFELVKKAGLPVKEVGAGVIDKDENIFFWYDG